MNEIPTEPETYSVELVCRNCGHKWGQRYPKGTPVPGMPYRSCGGLVDEMCPHCGVNDCDKAWE